MKHLLFLLLSGLLFVAHVTTASTYLGKNELRASALKAQRLPNELQVVKVPKKIYVFNLIGSKNTAYHWNSYHWSSRNHSNATTYAGLMNDTPDEAAAYADSLVEQKEAFIVNKGDKIAIKKIYIVNEPSPPYVKKSRDDAFGGKDKLREYNAQMVLACKNGYAWIEHVHAKKGMRYGVVRLLDLKGAKK